MGNVTKENILKVITAQELSQAKVDRAVHIRETAITFVMCVLDNVPDCADRDTAIRKIREARMDANSAIALNGKI